MYTVLRTELLSIETSVELYKDGFMPATALFYVTWTVAFTLLHA